MPEQPTPPSPENTGRLRIILHDKVKTVWIAANFWEGQAYSGAPTLPPLTTTPDTIIAEARAAFDAYLATLLPYTWESIERHLKALRQRYADRCVAALYNDIMMNDARPPEHLAIARSAVAALPREDPLTKRTRQSLSELLKLMRRKITPS